MRTGLNEEDIIIKETLKDTKQRVIEGEISYKSTLLGGSIKKTKKGIIFSGVVS